MLTVSVLCARLRVEERQCLEALAQAGASAALVSPASAPFGPSPSPTGPSAAAAADGAHTVVLIDRIQDRSVGDPVVQLHRATGARLVDAGLASTGDRLAVAAALAAAGIARPATILAVGEESALAATDAAGYPWTLLPLLHRLPGLPLVDHDTVEAVLEHRTTLGGPAERVGLLQAGAPNGDRVTVVVVGGEAIGINRHAGTPFDRDGAIALAERAARAIGAGICGVEVVTTADGLVAWDIDPVPDFRDAEPVGMRSVAEAIAELVSAVAGGGSQSGLEGLAGSRQGVTHGIAVTA